MPMDLRRYFDRIVLINLRKRPDRLARVRRALRACAWPFPPPVVFPAVEAALFPPPATWKHGAGAWGCLQSHLAVLENALQDGAKSVLILEDDVCFAENFRKKMRRFLRAVPDDWDGLMLGGQHVVDSAGWPREVRPGVYRCVDCERTHCYAVRGEYLAKLCRAWRRAGIFKGDAHCDKIMARNPQLQRAHRVYAPDYFVAGQMRGPSDVAGRYYPRRFWNPPGPELRLVNLHAPRAVAERLRQYGVHLGYACDEKTGRDRNLLRLFQGLRKNPRQTRRQLHDWIVSAQWEVCGDPGFVAAVWHPEASPALVQAASLWPVVEVTATTVAGALRQMPVKLKHL